MFPTEESNCAFPPGKIGVFYLTAFKPRSILMCTFEPKEWNVLFTQRCPFLSPLNTSPPLPVFPWTKRDHFTGSSQNVKWAKQKQAPLSLSGSEAKLLKANSRDRATISMADPKSDWAVWQLTVKKKYFPSAIKQTNEHKEKPAAMA